MGVLREIAGLRRSIMYDIRTSKKARWGTVAGMTGLTAAAAMAFSVAGGVGIYDGGGQSGVADNGDAIGEAGLVDQHDDRGPSDPDSLSGSPSDSPTSKGPEGDGTWNVPTPTKTSPSPSDDPTSDDPTPTDDPTSDDPTTTPTTKP